MTNVPAGRYVLVHRTNPERAIEESDYENNAASVLIQLRRAGAHPLGPRARALPGRRHLPGVAP